MRRIRNKTKRWIDKKVSEHMGKGGIETVKRVYWKRKSCNQNVIVVDLCVIISFSRQRRRLCHFSLSLANVNRLAKERERGFNHIWDFIAVRCVCVLVCYQKIKRKKKQMHFTLLLFLGRLFFNNTKHYNNNY